MKTILEGYFNNLVCIDINNVAYVAEALVSLEKDRSSYIIKAHFSLNFDKTKIYNNNTAVVLIQERHWWFLQVEVKQRLIIGL